MKPAAIRGLGAVGGFGCGLADLAEAVRRGASGPRNVSIETIRGTIATPGLTADTAALAERMPPRSFRRADHFTRMTLLAGLMALSDAGMTRVGERDLGLVLATGYGSTCNTFDFQELSGATDLRDLSPVRFSNSVHNAALAHLATHLGCRGPCITLNHFDMSAPLAIMTALRWLAEERTPAVLVGATDEFSRSMAWRRHHRLLERENGKASINKESRGEETIVDETIIGEGSVFFLLTPADSPDNAPPPYGYIAGATAGRLSRAGATAGRLSRAAPPMEGGLIISRSRELPETDRDFSAIHGALPVDCAFDMAIAALGRKVHLPAVPADAQIRCVKIGVAGEFGVVRLIPPPAA